MTTQTFLTAADRTIVERIEREAFDALKARAVAAGYTIGDDGAIIGRNALTGRPEPGATRTERWSDIVETVDGEFAITDPGDLVAPDPGARTRSVEIKDDAEGVPVRDAGDRPSTGRP